MCVFLNVRHFEKWRCFRLSRAEGKMKEDKKKRKQESMETMLRCRRTDQWKERAPRERNEAVELFYMEPFTLGTLCTPSSTLHPRGLFSTKKSPRYSHYHARKLCNILESIVVYNVAMTKFDNWINCLNKFLSHTLGIRLKILEINIKCRYFII